MEDERVELASEQLWGRELLLDEIRPDCTDKAGLLLLSGRRSVKLPLSVCERGKFFNVLIENETIL